MSTNKGGRPPIKDTRFPMVCPNNCGRLTRPYKAALGDYPGTVLAANQTGICNNCFRAMGIHSARPVRRTREEEDALIREWRSGLLAYIRNRRRRGIAPEGIPLPGEERQLAPSVIFGDRRAAAAAGVR